MGSKMTSSRHFHSVGWKAIAGIGLFPRTHLKHSCVGCCNIAGCSAKGSTLVMSCYLVPGCYRSAAEWEVVEG